MTARGNWKPLSNAAWAVLFVAGTATSSQASSIQTVTAAIAAPQTISTSLQVAQFDQSLGVLTGISFSVSASVSATKSVIGEPFCIERVSPKNGAITFSCKRQSAGAEVDVMLETFSPLDALSLVASNSDQAFCFTGSAPEATCTATATATASVMGNGSLTDQADLDAWVSLSALLFDFQIDVDDSLTEATVSVDYTYTPAVIPAAPAGLSLLGALGAMAIRRRMISQS